ncbi:hypothetical protein BSKO_13198 [Bryopsis sp. KO-2023]|nr:hypothetical protein BSKO_13198 [Bryopsis sp. KO-2023]
MGECKLKSNFNCRNPLPPDLIVSCGQKLENYFVFTKETVECDTVRAKPKESGGCSHFEGIDLGKGSTPIDDKTHVVDTPEDCCALCKKTNDCKTWTYIHVAAKRYPKGSCLLRKVLAPATKCSACTSGITIRDSPLDCEAATFNVNSNGRGGYCTMIRRPYLIKICDRCHTVLRLDANVDEIGADIFSLIKNPMKELPKAVQKECVSWTLLTTKTFHYEQFRRIFWREKGRCYLRNKVLKGVPCAVCISGVVAESGTSCFDDPSCRLLEGSDLAGYDFETIRVTNSPMECCKKCKKAKECKAWTRNKVSGQCWLKKKGAPVPRICAACDSGVMIKKG